MTPSVVSGASVFVAGVRLGIALLVVAVGFAVAVGRAVVGVARGVVGVGAGTDGVAIGPDAAQPPSANAVTTTNTMRFTGTSPLESLGLPLCPPSGAPLASKVLSPDGKGPGGARYVVSFAFDRQDGIEGELTAPDPSGTEPGPCRISLHYLPPGWVGHF